MTGEWIGAAVAAIASVGAAALTLRRRVSRDATEISKDRAETGVISRLQHMLEESHAREDAAVRMAKAEQELRVAATLRAAEAEGENRHLKSLLRKVGRMLPAEDRAPFETDFAPLGGPEKK